MRPSCPSYEWRTPRPTRNLVLLAVQPVSRATVVVAQVAGLSAGADQGEARALSIRVRVHPLEDQVEPTTIEELQAAIRAANAEASAINDTLIVEGRATATDTKRFNECIRQAREYAAEIDRRLKADPLAGVRELGESVGLRDESRSSNGVRQAHPWAKGVTDYVTRLVGFGAKELVPTGSVVVALPQPAVISDTIPVRQMRQLLVVEDAPQGFFRFLRQNTRSWQAAEVPSGEEKPESEVGLEMVEGRCPVVATVSPGIDRFLLSDAPALQQFVGNELSAAVEAAVEAAALAELADAGFDAVPFAVDPLTSLRRALETLELRGVTATGIVTHPSDWADVEVSRTTDQQWQLSPAGAPVNVVTRRAWSTPVLCTVACPKGTAYVGDFRSYARLFAADRGQVRLDWSEAAGFRTNEVTFRCETRVKLGVLLVPGFVTVAMAETPTPPVGGGGVSGGMNGEATPAQGATKKSAS